MKYGSLEKFQSGVAIPLFSLQSAESCGIGEFSDLPLLGVWAKSCGMTVIQILPVNDTGFEASPYSARSAFALHPVFLRLQTLDGATVFEAELAKIRTRFAKNRKVDFQGVVSAKLAFLEQFYLRHEKRISRDRIFLKWVESNTWVKAYSVYCLLKKENREKSWVNWKNHQNPSPGRIDTLWARRWKEALFHAWMQYESEKQFVSAAQELESMGLRLKGDVPILINEDSADVWAERRYFHLQRRAGAPPDMFSQSGQNWGFPTYNWESLKRAKYLWWKNRLKQAQKFYHAFRIDHVLGFFRIWEIPATERTGILGRFRPARPIERSTLEEAGIPPATIDYLIRPSFDGAILREILEELYAKAETKFLEAAEGEDRWRLRPEVSTEGGLFDAVPEGLMRAGLLQVLWNRVLLSGDEENEFFPFWNYYLSPAFKGLPAHEQEILRKVIESNAAGQEDLWKEHATEILKMMSSSTDMLVCAEDLGVVPHCVPEVLEDLGIFSLRIDRWTRNWDANSQPFIEPTDYPRLSVCTTSCHDTSTIRGWWEEESTNRNLFYPLLGLSGLAPLELGAGLAFRILKRILSASSKLAILPLQDWLSPFPETRLEKAQEERINVPGTMGPENWRWRMPLSLEALQRESGVIEGLRELTEERACRAIHTRDRE